MTITIEDMREKLQTLDEAREVIAASEPLSTHQFGPGGAKFKLYPGWNIAAETLSDNHLVDAAVTVGATEFQLTKAALLEATSACGLTKKYVERTPAKYIEPQLNYWFTEGFPESKTFQLLTADGTGSALVRASITPYSNLGLLEQIENGIKERYGEDVEILTDRKLHHTLSSTHLRLVVPEHSRNIERTGTDEDTWSVGVALSNSLTGAGATAVEAYLFRYWCTNGAIDTRPSLGVWSRRGGSDAEVYEWARRSVDEVLGGLEPSLDAVQELADIHLEDDDRASAVLHDIFETYRVPVGSRTRIVNNMVDSDQMTMYSIMQAITSAANGDDVDPKHADDLMRVGGELTTTARERCESCHRLMVNH